MPHPNDPVDSRFATQRIVLDVTYLKDPKSSKSLLAPWNWNWEMIVDPDGEANCLGILVEATDVPLRIAEAERLETALAENNEEEEVD